MAYLCIDQSKGVAVVSLTVLLRKETILGRMSTYIMSGLITPHPGIVQNSTGLGEHQVQSQSISNQLSFQFLKIITDIAIIAYQHKGSSLISAPT